MRPMDVGTQVAAAVAGLVHVWFFVLESQRFMRPSVYGRFGLASDAEAAIVRPWAFNQGYYNLFLAAGVAIGLGLANTGSVETGRAIVLFACGSMVAAGVVLFLYNRSYARAALIQALPPLVAIVGALISQPQ